MSTQQAITAEASKPHGAHGHAVSTAAGFDFWRTAHRAVRGRGRVVALLTLAGTLAGAGLGLLAGKRQYTATGLVRVASSLPAVLRETDQNKPIAMFDGFIQAQTQVMSGREVIDAALKSEAWAKAGGKPGFTPEQFASSLKIDTRQRSDFLQVKFTHSNAQVASTGVQTVIAAYRDVFNRDQDRAEEARLNVLQQRRAELSAQAAALQARIDETSNGRTLAEIDPLFTEASDRLRKLRAALTDIQIAIAGGPGLLSTRVDNPGASASSSTSVRQWVASKIFTLECELVEARAHGVQDTHPTVARLLASIKGYREQLATLPAEAEVAVPDPSLVAASRKPLQEREANLRTMVEAAQAELNQLSTERTKLARLSTQSDSLRQQLADTEQRLDALTTESSAGSRLAIVSAGDRPMTAVLDNRAKTALAGAFFGGCFPVGLLMTGTLLRRRYRTGEELAEDMAEQAPFVTVVPRIDAGVPGTALAARCIHAARARLLQGVTGSRVYMVSSAGQAEGKTSIALSLGLSFAASGARTLIIDANLASPQLTRSLGADQAQGLFEAVDSGATPLLQHLRAGPWVLTSGHAGDRNAGRLRPEALRLLLADLRSRFDIILIDTDSLLHGLTAPVVAPHADGIILTVRAGARHAEVGQAARQARQCGSLLAAAVFNAADPAQFPRSLTAQMESTPARSLPEAAAAFGPLVGAVLQSLSLTREDDLRLAPSGLDLAPSNSRAEQDAHDARESQQDRPAA